MPVAISKSQPNSLKMALLNDYLSMPRLPFAVLVRGKWGAGKTWFVKQFMKSYPEYDYCYISLFGLTEIEQINKSMLALDICPALLAVPAVPAPCADAATPADMTGESAPVGISAGSVGGCGLSAARITAAAEGESIWELAANENMVFIFDDFERNSIGEHILMGFINNFVENSKAKVVIVCNEERVRSDWYALYREKVIGGAITVEADPENALSSAIAHICMGDCAPVADILDGLQPELLSIFREAGVRNLRLLSRLVLDSCRLYRAFTPEMRRDSAFLRLALTHLAAYSPAVYAHNDDPRTYPAFVHDFFADLQPLCAVHPWLKPVPPGGREFWTEFFTSGLINRDLEQFHHYLKKGEAAEPPLRLWAYTEMEDLEFKQTVSRLLEDLKEQRYQSPGLLLHAFSDLLFLAAHGLIEMRVKDVLAYAKKYLSAFQFPRHSRYDGQDSDCRFEDDCSHGMIFLAWDMPELETIKELVKEKLTGADHALAVDSLLALVRDLEKHPEECRHDKIRELAAGEELLLFEAVEPMRIVELIDQVPAGQRHLLFNQVLHNYTRQQSEAQLDAENSRLLNNWINGFESGLKGLCNNKELSPLRCEIYDEMAATAGRFKSGGK